MLPTYLIDSIILLTAAVILVPLMQYLRLGSIIGFLTAGVVVGPWVLSLITEVEEIRHFAELGVAFLLFIIGVELKPKRLLLMRKWVFGLGSAQVIVTGIVFMGIALLLGLNVRQGIIIGFGLALSSTAFVLQLLTDQGLIGTQPGRRSFAILLLQDLAVVPLLALVPLLTQTDVSLGLDLAIAFGEAALILIIIIVGGRFFLRPLLHLVARSGNLDIFAAAALLLVLGVAGLITMAGFSMAMGAFVAGLLIADSEYRHQVLADIQPFRGFLLGLFFMSVGMSMDFGALISDWQYLVLALIGLLSIKAIIIWALARFFGIQSRPAFAVALILAQSGEFGFVIFGVALTHGLLEKTLFDQLILVVTLSMIITPALAYLSKQFFVSNTTSTDTQPPEDKSDFVHKVIIVGFGRVGRRIAKMMDFANTPYIAIDSNADLVNQYRSEGFPVYFGNAESFDVLISVGVKNSRLVVVTIDQQETSKLLVRELRRLSTTLHILARGRDSAHCEQLLVAGADEAVSEAFEASLQLGAEVLQRLDQPSEQIQQVQQKMRDGGNLKSEPLADDEELASQK
ncbi:MAG: monovalent cation:proton antiporter-2 (CPA2) family protein [Alphaproteobacteria bacterium]|nr:monovalent cation:proton antiporter-2 (CPA2) family protein [Rhodospirillales bacterium]MCW9045340.1 monovalent cation:proton antiporter-2 (CPA2) family protein [Alphaproteobacteria bacterium]